jgi:hypothetical protein
MNETRDVDFNQYDEIVDEVLSVASFMFVHSRSSSEHLQRRTWMPSPNIIIIVGL